MRLILIYTMPILTIGAIYLKMTHIIRTLKYFSLVVLLAGLAIACQQSAPAASEAQTVEQTTAVSEPDTETQKINVSATIFPIYDIAAQIAGDKANVTLVMNPGDSPHTYEATPSDIIEVSGADLILAIGNELDHWIENMVEDSSAEIVTVDANIALRTYENEHDDHDGHDDHDKHDDHDGHDDHNHGEFDPHYWLSAQNGKIIAVNIANALSEVDPDNSDYYMTNVLNFQASIDVINSEIVALATPVSTKPFIPLHDGWNYYCAEFDLNLVDNFFPGGQHQSTPQHTIELTEKVANLGVTAIFSEIGLDTSAIKGFAEDNDLIISQLDPLGGSPQIQNYQDLLLQNMKWINEGLK